MDLHKRVLQIGTAVIVGALLFRFGGTALEYITNTMAKPEVASLFLFLETGRVVRPLESQAVTNSPTEPSTVTTYTNPTIEKAVAVFSDEDIPLVEINNTSDYPADVSAFLQQPLAWDLTQGEPTVLIVHSHGTESYANTENYEEYGQYRTLDTQYNVISIGQAICNQLAAEGIQVIHDTTAHDYPSYTDSYNQARNAIEHYLEEYPTIRLVLDIHRDSIEDESGQQVSPTVSYNGEEAAQLMLVMGTDANGLIHPHWEENMALAVKLHAQLEKTCPGICRPLCLRKQRYNQDLSSGALLIEVGTAGNTHQEALAAAEVLSQSILDLAYGTDSSYHLS